MERTELETIIYEKEGAVARIILNTPQKANVQTAQQVWDMEECLKIAGCDEEVKVLILKGEGKGFCAGHAIVHDADEFQKAYPTSLGATERTWKNHNYDLFTWPPIHLWEFPKITISQVHGYCLGGGTVYSYLTDLTVASDDAYFQMPLPQGFGLPGAQTMIEPWLFMNWKQTFEYLLLAPTFSAEEAMEKRLVNAVVPREELEGFVEDWAATIAQMPLTTLMTIKAGVKRAWETMGMRTHLQASSDLLTICSTASDVQAYMSQMGKSRPRQFAASKKKKPQSDGD